jgi:hypothetical protein
MFVVRRQDSKIFHISGFLSSCATIRSLWPTSERGAGGKGELVNVATSSLPLLLVDRTVITRDECCQNCFSSIFGEKNLQRFLT